MDEFLDGMASFFGQDSDSIIGGRTELPGGGVKRTWADNIWGRSQEELDAAQGKVKTKELGNKYDGQLGMYGLEPVKPGEGVTSITSRLRKGKDEYEDGRIKRNQDLTYNNPTARDERETRDRRYNDTQRMLIQDRIDAREDKNQQWQYMKMQDRKEDRRYNEQMERLDRKDRKMAMQGIVAGLASLGAAFAI